MTEFLIRNCVRVSETWNVITNLLIDYSSDFVNSPFWIFKKTIITIAVGKLVDGASCAASYLAQPALWMFAGVKLLTEEFFFSSIYNLGAFGISVCRWFTSKVLQIPRVFLGICGIGIYLSIYYDSRLLVEIPESINRVLINLRVIRFIIFFFSFFVFAGIKDEILDTSAAG